MSFRAFRLSMSLRLFNLSTSFRVFRLPTYFRVPLADHLPIFFSCRRPFEVSTYRRFFVISAYPTTFKDLQKTLTKFEKQIVVFLRMFDISVDGRLSKFSAFLRIFRSPDVVKKIEKNRPLSDIFQYLRLPTFFK